MWLKNIKKYIWSIFKMQNRKNLSKKLYPDLGEDIIKTFFDNYNFAISLSALNMIKNIQINHKPLLTIEFGSGVSTIVNAKFMNKDTELITIDESEIWLNKTFTKIKENKKITKVILKNQDYNSLYPYFRNQKIANLLIIDGPTGERFSESAINLYNKIIDKNTICLIDDTDRKINNEFASLIAKDKYLIKKDYTDSIFPNQKYSILWPKTNE